MNKFHPMVSIVIPVYNGSNYLREAIDSALAQTYDNLEIIVVNDGSNDEGKTEKIALSYGDNIRYFSKPNGGTSTALNLGIRNMIGSYFSWLSHDDLYAKNKIAIQIQELAKLEDKNTIMMSDLDGIDEDYKKIYQTDYILHIKNYPPRESSRLHPIIYNQTHGCTLLIPKACFDKVGLFDEKELVAQDFEFFYRAFKEFPHKLISQVLVTARDSSNRQGRRSKKRGDEEYSKLFIKIIENLTEEEVKSLAPSRIEFFLDMRNFFRDAEYSIALNYIKRKMFSNLQISSYDLIGNRFNGHDLHIYLREHGIDSKQLVQHKESNDNSTFVYDFNAPNSSKELLQQSILLDTDIVHLHLVHNIIDVNYLPIISKIKPTIITLHDPFYLGGHCVHHFDCKKWTDHCADCPYLDKDFRLFNDTSALNFALKKQAIQNSSITGIVASKWMRDKVEKSPVWNGKKIYLLPFGIDQGLFMQGDSKSVRNELKIPAGDIVLMFRSDSWEVKGLDIIKSAMKRSRHVQGITILTVGEKGLLTEFADKYNIKEFGWVKDDSLMVKLYQACDVFLMPSRQETFGLMAVEAMSCGKVVLAINGDGTALPEIIHSPECGIAVDEEKFAEELDNLLDSRFEILDRGNRCADFARETYSKDVYVQRMMQIYDEVIQNWVKDDEADLLLHQLKKYANDNYSLGHHHSEQKGTFNKKKDKEKVILKLLKKLIRFAARCMWMGIKTLRMDKLVKSSNLYSHLERKGIISKLRG